LARISRSLARPFRAVILALSVHVFFAAMFGISLQFEPKIMQISPVEPVQAVVIDQAAIEREEMRKEDLQRQREEEVRRQAEKKKAERLEVKRQEDLKKRQEVEIKRKQEEKKIREAEAKRQAEEKKKRKAEEQKKHEAEEKKIREAEAKRQAEAKRKKEAEAKRQAEAKRKKEAEAKRQADEKKRREQEAHEQLKRDAVDALVDLKGPIRDKIYSNWTYFGEASDLEVRLLVKVSREGEVTASEVIRSSGDLRFDISAQNAVRKSSPLPFPDDPRYYEFIKEFYFTGSK
jgi:colicin import membrane protein